MMKRTPVLLTLLLLSCTRSSPPAPESKPTPKPTAEVSEPAPNTDIVAAKPPPPEEDGPPDTSPSPEESNLCSASGMRAQPAAPRAPLPAPVESMRRRIVAAAVACDYKALATLAREKGAEFTFDSETDLEAAFREREKKGEPVLRLLVRLLNLPHAQLDTLYAWPSVFSPQATPEDWKALEGVYTPAQVAEFRANQEGYDGIRTGIDASGDWQFVYTGEQGE
jgi:hypothetical protein